MQRRREWGSVQLFHREFDRLLLALVHRAIDVLSCSIDIAVGEEEEEELVVVRFDPQRCRPGWIQMVNSAGDIDRGVTDRDGFIQLAVTVAALFRLDVRPLELLALELQLDLMHAEFAHQRLDILGADLGQVMGRAAEKT